MVSYDKQEPEDYYYSRFAYMIVARACIDYMDAYKYLNNTKIRRVPSRMEISERAIIDCERFFRSDWCALLMQGYEVDPDTLIGLLQKKALWYMKKNRCFPNNYVTVFATFKEIENEE